MPKEKIKNSEDRKKEEQKVVKKSQEHKKITAKQPQKTKVPLPLAQIDPIIISDDSPPGSPLELEYEESIHLKKRKIYDNNANDYIFGINPYMAEETLVTFDGNKRLAQNALKVAYRLLQLYGHSAESKIIYRQDRE